MTDDFDTAADDAAYAALEREMEDAAIEEGDDGDAPFIDRSDRPEPSGREADDGDDDEATEQAYLQAEQLEAQMRQQWEHQQRQRIPDAYEDPIGRMRYLEHHVAQQQQHHDYQRFMGAVERAENEFVEKVPDYHEAAEHLEQSRRSELEQMFPDRSPHAIVQARQAGYSTPKQLREAIFRNDAKTVAMHAMQSGQNPAEAYYNLAKGRGYQPKGEAAFANFRSGRGAAKASSGRGGNSGKSVDKLLNLYADGDGDAFDREWDKMARAGALG